MTPPMGLGSMLDTRPHLLGLPIPEAGGRLHCSLPREQKQVQTSLSGASRHRPFLAPPKASRQRTLRPRLGPAALASLLGLLPCAEEEGTQACLRGQSLLGLPRFPGGRGLL